jgi:pimeloyl-ACP methyl ester carboxylesterase
MARDGINVLDHLDINQAHILGTSMGGMIGQIICAKVSSTHVKTFTLIASTASVPGPLNGAIKRGSRHDGKPVTDYKSNRMDEVYQRELKWVGLIGMEGKDIDTPKFKEDTINNFNRIKGICKDGYGYARQLNSDIYLQKIESKKLNP